VRQAIAQAHRLFGRLDVIVNNAGYTLVGTVEEASEADVRALFETNYFGMLRVLQAALPLLRQQGRGQILGVSSGMGIVAVPLIGFYCATKWAVEALHESLAQEVKGFGIKVTLIEPGGLCHGVCEPSSLKLATGMDVYADLRQRMASRLSTEERGDPKATPEAIPSVHQRCRSHSGRGGRPGRR
jgi:NAD(P)-dependent dehydrogenase (short-subunit alcohol dehydrogenase family)